MWSDFIGFTFDGVHSSELNILRVSDGDRYSEALIPEIEDQTVETKGKDGVYYYGSFYTSRDIEINIAFDSVTEEQYRNIRRLFGQKKICKLIFDERPYKVYYVKVAEPITLETICFDEEEYEWISHNDQENNGGYIPGSINHKQYTGNYKRIYKGEGTIRFIAYDPFARQLYKELDLYATNGYDNVDEWSESSGILTTAQYTEGAFDIYQDISESNVRYSSKYNGQINVYNPGDIDAPYYLFIPYVNNQIKPDESRGDDVVIATDGSPDLIIEPFEKGELSSDQESSDTKQSIYAELENGIIINTRAELIEGVYFDPINKYWHITGNLYNKHIKRGSFGKIFKGNKFDFRHQGIYLNCAVSTQKPEIFYDYLYY